MIRVALTRPRDSYDLVSWVVRAVTGRPYSHVALILDGEDCVRGLPVALDASTVGVRLVPYEDFLRANIVVHMYMPAVSLGRAVDAMLPALGIRYDALGLVGEGWVTIVRRWFHKAVRNPLRSPRALWCSEYVALVLRAAHYPGADKVDPFTAAPSDIDDLMRGASP